MGRGCPQPGSGIHRALIRGSRPHRRRDDRRVPILRDCPPLDELPHLFGSRVVTVSQLEELGFNRRTIAYRCRPGGPWTRMAPGIVKLDNGPITRDDHRCAALVHAGPGACITGLDRLALSGFRSIPAPFGPVHVLIPHDRRRIGRTLALVERTDRLPTPSAGRWPLAPVPRAVLDFARRTSDRPMVRAVVAEAVQQRHCSVGDLGVELRLGCQRGSAMPRTVLAEIGDGVRSAAEATARALLRDLVRNGLLPAPTWNTDLLDDDGVVVARPDAWFDEAGLAWEIDSVEYHLSPADYARTVARRSALMAHGAIVVQTLPSTLSKDPDTVRTELVRCLAQARLLPRPTLYPASPANERHPRAV
jgi:hypothetical protein